jgi:hypothetical protein
MILNMIVRRTIAGDAELMKKVADFSRHYPLELQPAEKIGLRFLRRG